MQEQVGNITFEMHTKLPHNTRCWCEVKFYKKFNIGTYNHEPKIIKIPI
jgi:hypothetical protein